MLASAYCLYLFVEQSESIMCRCTSHLLWLLSWRLSSHCWAVNRLLYLWSCSLACHHLLSSQSLCWDFLHWQKVTLLQDFGPLNVHSFTAVKPKLWHVSNTSFFQLWHVNMESVILLDPSPCSRLETRNIGKKQSLRTFAAGANLQVPSISLKLLHALTY